MAHTKQTALKSRGGKVLCRKFAAKAKSKMHYFISARKSCSFRSGTVVLREIYCYQKSTELLLPKLHFQRWVRDISNGINIAVKAQI